jgi:OOP family OmpA-OmpF porin
MRGSQITCARPRGQSATPVLVFLGIVVLSVVFFFVLTLPRQFKNQRAVAVRVEPSPTEPAAAAVPGGGTTDAGTPAETSRALPPAAAPTAVRFTSPRHLMEALASHLASGDFAAAEAVLGDGVLSDGTAAFWRSLFTTADLRPAVLSPVREIGDLAELYRWALRLEERPPSPDPISGDAAVDRGRSAEAAAPGDPPPGSFELEVDIARDPARGWRAVAVHFPEPLRQRVASRVAADGLPPVLAPAVADADDPLHIAGRFLQAAFRQDFAAARGVTDAENVSREKVAGLCILFEEGAYSLAAQRPLSATAAGRDSAWVIVKVASGHDGHESDFGLELRRFASGRWQVAGINFSKLLARYAASAGATEGVAYTPIVRNPSGGESLVVYFDFNDATLVPRARRQLEIVANLLRDDPRRQLRLSGHADAIGSDTYNRRLSAARALVVKDTLASLGVSPAQIVSEGLGTLRPLDPNTHPDGSDNPEGRSRNRRTEIYLDF